VIEAAWVLFREGLESLLMIRRAKNRWVGFTLAVICSVTIGVLINIVLGPLLDSFRGIVALTAACFLGYILTKEDEGELAFFAVFREGMETVLFYTAIVRTTPVAQLFLGAILGAIGVVIAAVLIFKYGVKSDRFMLASTVVLWWLAVKFVGIGITELGLGRTPIALWPDIAWLGLFPNLEAIVAQIIFIGGACAIKRQSRLSASSPRATLA
jgi:high-affinity Fe2+/Pb2+ permease